MVVGKGGNEENKGSWKSGENCEQLRTMGVRGRGDLPAESGSSIRGSLEKRKLRGRRGKLGEKMGPGRGTKKKKDNSDQANDPRQAKSFSYRSTRKSRRRGEFPELGEILTVGNDHKWGRPN